MLSSFFSEKPCDKQAIALFALNDTDFCVFLPVKIKKGEKSGRFEFAVPQAEKLQVAKFCGRRYLTRNTKFVKIMFVETILNLFSYKNSTAMSCAVNQEIMRTQHVRSYCKQLVSHELQFFIN